MKDKPTNEGYYKDGTICYRSWWENGKRHRLNGLPAFIWYYRNGVIESQEWWEDNIQLSDRVVLRRQYQWFIKITNIIDKEGIEL